MSSEKGGCYCGNIKISFTEAPLGIALCHCIDCRKISGSAFSSNIVVLTSNFTLESGTPKTFTKTNATGNVTTFHFCGDCGTSVFGTSAASPHIRIIKAGVLDNPDWPSKNVPTSELFTPSRISWLCEIPGASQTATMT